MRFLAAALPLLAIFSNALHPVLTSSMPSSDVQMSLDDGATWLDCNMASVPTLVPRETHVMFRLRNWSSFISLPSCAAVSGPAVFSWSAIGAIGVRSEFLCKGNPDSFKPLIARPIHMRPAWHHFIREPDSDERPPPSVSGYSSGELEDGGKKKQKGFWGKYGIYIAAFVAVSLLQGIREGNVQFQQQMEEERRQEEARQAGSEQKTNIVVPRRKSGKGKKQSGKKQ